VIPHLHQRELVFIDESGGHECNADRRFNLAEKNVTPIDRIPSKDTTMDLHSLHRYLHQASMRYLAS